jgi:hypothetical protein
MVAAVAEREPRHVGFASRAEVSAWSVTPLTRTQSLAPKYIDRYMR